MVQFIICLGILAYTLLGGFAVKEYREGNDDEFVVVAFGVITVFGVIILSVGTLCGWE